MTVAIENLSYEEAIKALDGLIERLSKGQLSLEATMEAYEQGMALALHCQQQLTKAEGTLKKIEGEFIQAFDLEETDHEPL